MNHGFVFWVTMKAVWMKTRDVKVLAVDRHWFFFFCFFYFKQNN